MAVALPGGSEDDGGEASVWVGAGSEAPGGGATSVGRHTPPSSQTSPAPQGGLQAEMHCPS